MLSESAICEFLVSSQRVWSQYGKLIGFPDLNIRATSDNSQGYIHDFSSCFLIRLIDHNKPFYAIGYRQKNAEQMLISTSALIFTLMF